VLRLSGTDAGFLYAETASWHMHAGAVIVLDPSTAPDRFDVDRVRQLIAARLRLLGPFRYRLVEVPFGIDRPYWVEAVDLDLATHVQSASLPSPGGTSELGRFAADVFAHKLDRRRPLWKVWFVDGLAHGRVALVVKLHHAYVDGLRGARLYDVMVDADREAPLDRGVLLDDGATPRRPTPLAFTVATASGLALAPVRTARALASLARAITGVARFARAPEHADVTLPFRAAPGCFTGSLTPARSVAFSSLPMSLVRDMRERHHVTFNDVVLTACTGAIRSYLLARGTAPTRPLVVAVPVGVRRETGAEPAVAVTPGNFISAMGAQLPVHIDDPVDQLNAVVESTRSAKALHRAFGSSFLLDLVDAVPPGAIAAAVRAYTSLHLEALHPPIFNLLVSNVAGARAPVFLAGARLLATYPLGPLLAGSGLNVTVLSHDEKVDAGFIACPDIVEDVWALANGLPPALELLAGSSGVVAGATA